MNDDTRQRVQRISIRLDQSILDALRQMDETYHRLLLVFDADGSFQTILSIGDIQRAIIRNANLDTPVADVVRADPMIARSDQSDAAIRERMLEHRIECMPVVDASGALVQVYFWEDVFNEAPPKVSEPFDLPVVIMAGGKGTRLRPITHVLPKALIPVGEKPMLQHIVDRFHRCGCSQFHLTLNYKGDMIEHYFDQQTDRSYAVHHVYEQEFLGTAGSLHLLKDVIRSTFFVSNCDILIEDDYAEMLRYHRENGNDLTVVAALKHYHIPYGTIETGEGGLLETMNEKPDLTYLINSGMYILEPELIKRVPEGTFYHITDLIDDVRADGGRVGVFPVSEKSWKDVGEWDEYLKNKDDQTL